jgi:GMP synthase-like glutamine amidotransferase
VRRAWVTEAGEQVFLPSLKEFRLHYHHNDAILKLPPGFLNLASNNVTEFQSIVSSSSSSHPIFLTSCLWKSASIVFLPN